jgi:23S rRNA pseudouridine2605 synthase
MKQGDPEMPPPSSPEGDRIAKVLSRAGVASRREAERLIALGEVRVNGKVIDSPALNVTAKDRIEVKGAPLPRAEPARLWLYYKPEGLVTSASDEKGRDTIFDHLPEDLPRVMSIGRLDLTSEGLLLLTNDGGLKRRLELPSTGWLRKYRVRVNGRPTDEQLEPLRRGIVVEGDRFQPMQVVLDRVQGANAWLTVGLREGKNREIRRAMVAVGLYVNRLIRVSYGPFRLNEMTPGAVEEVRARILRDQLGPLLDDRAAEAADDAAPKKLTRTRKPRPTGDILDLVPAKPAPRAGKLAPGEGLKTLSRAWKDATDPDRRKPAAKAGPAAAGAKAGTRAVTRGKPASAPRRPGPKGRG